MRTQPIIGYFTEAWNPPKIWVSPERIALTRISAQHLVPRRKFLMFCPSTSQRLKTVLMDIKKPALTCREVQVHHNVQTFQRKVSSSIPEVCHEIMTLCPLQEGQKSVIEG